MTRTVHDAIAAAERLLPGIPAPDGESDPRWQAIIEVEEFLPSNPNEIWPFIRRWGSHEDDDLRAAIATCLLEHLLEDHFEIFFTKVEQAVKDSPLFADTFLRCGRFGQAKEPANTARFTQLTRLARELNMKSR